MQEKSWLFFGRGLSICKMRQTKLSQRDLDICLRLAEARETLGFTQKECARQIGLERSTFLNYEHCRTPLRFEIALRFCRQFIVSEEWLATGRHDAGHDIARREGIHLGPGLRDFDRKVLFRQCVDLLSEPVSLHIAPGTLFSVAYDRVLKDRYRELVSQYFHLPRICLSDADRPELAINLLSAINERFIVILSNEALRRGSNPSAAWRVYTRCLFECSDLAFRKMMGFRLKPADLASLDWLRAAISDPDYMIPFIGEVSKAD